MIRVPERSTHLAANLLRIELECAHTFARIALSTNDTEKRIRNVRNAITAYNTALRFFWLVAHDREQARELGSGIERMKHKLVAVRETRWDVGGRRIADRIRGLVAKAEEFPINSPEFAEITQLIKSELSEYFEREKNPLYGADRRASE